jgi:hypothetical protein
VDNNTFVIGDEYDLTLFYRDGDVIDHPDMNGRQFVVTKVTKTEVTFEELQRA